MGNKKPLRILIVDDREENLDAAKEYFDTVENIAVDFASNYEEAMQKLNNEKYDLAMFDLQLPRTKNSGDTEKLGFKLAEEAERYTIPWAVITMGIDHHQCRSAFVNYFYEPNREVHEITETPKTDPRAWERVFNSLLLNGLKRNDKPLYWTLKRINPRNPAKALLTPPGKRTLKVIHDIHDAIGNGTTLWKEN